VARAEEIEKALLGDRDGLRDGRVGGGVRVIFRLHGGGLRLGAGAVCRLCCWGMWGSAALAGRRFEGSHSDLEAVDHLAGAAGVDGVLSEAVDDGGEGDEDGGAVFDDWKFHAGDLGIDEDAIGTFGVLDVVVVAVVFAFEGGRAAALAGWSLVMVALLVATEVWNWCRHSVPPWVSISA
jgi:hypothetical protein